MRARISRTWIGLAHHVVDARGKQIERLVQGLVVVHGDDRGAGAAPDEPRKPVALHGNRQEEMLHGKNILLGYCLHPAVEVGGAKPGCRYALPVEPGCIAVLYGFALLNNDDHGYTSNHIVRPT